jgi:DNA-directed RNA polymerase specialized sigma subunit
MVDSESSEIIAEIIDNDGENGKIRGEVNANDDVNQMESESNESESESQSDNSSSESKEEYELEEDEIVDFDCDDSEDDSEEMTRWGVHDDDDRSQGHRSRNELELLLFT